MKYYKSETGEVFVYEADGSQDAYIKPHLTQMTDEEVNTFLNTVFEEVPTVDPKLVGVEFDGVMCSATKEDMWGLSSVAPWIESGNSTAFEFDNGNVLVLTPENYQAFYEVWASFRASFFNKVE